MNKRSKMLSVPSSARITEQSFTLGEFFQNQILPQNNVKKVIKGSVSQDFSSFSLKTFLPFFYFAKIFEKILSPCSQWHTYQNA